MRIAVFTDTYLPTVDGVVNSIRNTRTTLEAQGHEVLIIAPGAGTAEDGRNRTLYCRSHELRRYPGYRLAVYPSRREQAFLKDCGVDLVHSHGIAFMGLKGMWAARELNLPMVLTFHTMIQDAIPHYTSRRAGGRVLERLVGLYLRSFLHRCGAVVAPTEVVLEELRRLAPAMRRTAVIPSGVNVQRFHPGLDGGAVRERHGLENAEVILHVGRVAPEKNVDLLLRAFPLLRRRRPHARLLVVGAGPALPRCRRIVEEHGMEELVQFAGFVPDEELPAYYAASDALATASAFETQGLVVLEAMACGLPVAAVNYRAFPEYIQDGRNGFLYSPGDPQAGSEAMERALAAGEDVRVRARETAERFSLESCAERLLALYETMLP